jgi:CobQ-like glutamine amidotransferase family enzyme
VSPASTLRIAVVFPDLLGTYGDRGNAAVLARRWGQRGQAAEVIEITSEMPVPASCDVYLLGGGEDLAQDRAAGLLEASVFPATVQAGAAVLAVCAGLQILGRAEHPAAGTHPGVGILDATTSPGGKRAIGETLTRADPALGLGEDVLSGFENHAGRTRLGRGARPLGRIEAGIGNGDGTDGAVQGMIVATYLHGPVLARNPALADYLLVLATGATLPPLEMPDLAELRQDRIAAARTRRAAHRPARARLRALLVPRRWETPGIPPPRDRAAQPAPHPGRASPGRDGPGR